MTLRIGRTEEPDNLNPFIGYQNETCEIWALNYDLLFGYGDRNQPTLDLAAQLHPHRAATRSRRRRWPDPRRGLRSGPRAVAALRPRVRRQATCVSWMPPRSQGGPVLAGPGRS